METAIRSPSPQEIRRNKLTNETVAVVRTNARNNMENLHPSASKKLRRDLLFVKTTIAACKP
jgi:hypothetical protein